MKHFESPEIAIVRFKVEDIITNSLPFTPLSILEDDELELTDIGKP